jgi:hypothetical protein
MHGHDSGLIDSPVNHECPLLSTGLPVYRATLISVCCAELVTARACEVTDSIRARAEDWAGRPRVHRLPWA